MMTVSNSEPTLRDLAEKLDHLSSDMTQVKQWQERTTEELSQVKQWQERTTEELSQVKQWQERTTEEINQSQKWQDRTWDVIKWVGGISAGLAISASIALVGIVLRQLAGS